MTRLLTFAAMLGAFLAGVALTAWVCATSQRETEVGAL